MKFPPSIRWIPLAFILPALVWPARGEEMVTIPKTRLLELERKEKELDAIKGTANQAPAEKVQAEKAQATARAEQQELERKQKELEAMKRTLDQAEKEKAQLAAEKAQLQKAAEQSQKAQLAAEAKAAAAAAANAEPVIAHDTPPLATLPPLQKGQVVDAMDLMNHYRADPVGAAKRYQGQRIRVRGVATGFAKPPFIRPYEILLQTTEQKWKVICNVDPPDQFSAVFTTKHGEELVGSNSAGARMTLARIGQKVMVEASCKGLKDEEVKLSGCRLISVEP